MNWPKNELLVVTVVAFLRNALTPFSISMLNKLKSLLSGVLGFYRVNQKARQFFSQCRATDKSVATLTGISEHAEKAIILARERATQEVIERKLRTAPVSVLANYGARVQPLVANGFVYAIEMERQTRTSLERLNGVGEVTSTAALSAYQLFKEHTTTTASLEMNPDRLTPAESHLLEAVSTYDHICREAPDLIDKVTKQRKELGESIGWIRGHAKPLKMMTSKASQKEVSDYIDQITPYVRGVGREAELAYGKIRDGAKTSGVGAAKRFGDNSAWFFSILDAIGLRQQSRPESRQGSSPRREGRAESSRGDRREEAEQRTSSGIRRGNGRSGGDDDREEVERVVFTEKLAYEPSWQISRGGIYGELPQTIASGVESLKLHKGLLLATLRRYQMFGAQYIIQQKRTLLGDDMGLGKTVQVLAAMCHLHEQGKRHFFVIAPKSVLINWEREVIKHTKLVPLIIHGSNRQSVLEQWKRSGGVGITTYGTIGALAEDMGVVDMVAVDEAHLIKNRRAKRTAEVGGVIEKAEFVALMSGTALENRLSELHALVTLVQPGIKSRVDYLIDSDFPHPEEARRRVAPVYLRRKQQDVLVELPEKTEVDEYVTLTAEELHSEAAQKSDLMNRRLATTIGASNGYSAKYERLKELLEVYEAEGRKVAIFSFFRRVLSDVVAFSGNCAEINGDLSSGERLAIIDRFGSQSGFAVLALQVEAGGIGLNLQAAQVVILMEPQMKPSTEAQAIARVYRMGQSRKVMVHRLIALDSVDEDLVRLIAEKQLIFDQFADPSAIKEKSLMAVDSTSGQSALQRELSQRDEHRRFRQSRDVPSKDDDDEPDRDAA